MAVSVEPKDTKRKTEIVYGEKNIINSIVSFMQNTKERMDLFGDKNGSSIIITHDIYKNNYVKARERAVKIRYITEIAKDNLHYCKEVRKIVDEFRHLEGLKGVLAVNESEYVGTTVLKEKEHLTHVICSTEKEVIEQQQYTFDTFWKNAIPYEQRIIEVEQGIERIKTEVLENPQDISKRITDLARNSDYMCICTTFGGMRLIFNNFFETYKDVLEKHRNGKHRGIRWLSSINKSDIELVKIFLNEGMDIRHLKDEPSLNFALSNKLFNSTIEKMEEGKMVTSLFSSNDTLYLSHYQAVFEELWKKGIDVRDRVKDIEEGRSVNMEIIPNADESLKLYRRLSESAKHEVLILLPSANGFFHTDKSGGFKFLNEIASKGVRVKVLGSSSYYSKDVVDKITSKYPHIEFRSLQLNLQILNRIVIFDRSKTVVLEIKDDSERNFHDAFGMMIYIESKSTAMSYASIFDSLWRQTEMYEQLQTHDKMQKEFINVAAHELRTPIQPILGITRIVREEIKDNEQKKLLDTVIRNAERLKKLAEDILDVTRIDSKSLVLKKEHFNICETMVDVVHDYEGNIDNRIIKFECSFSDDDCVIFADKDRIRQAISNIIGNAVKFVSDDGTISVDISKRKSNSDLNGYTVVVSIKDNGSGIDSEMLDTLFTKFTTKSFQGTGLGLYITKSIIEAHGGHIWAENNRDEKGATFSFSLPLNF
ncbi:MAG TPA: HAMP domain-containing sensor histidine kinase [Bacillales bacterium]|nr:HAMP domain-containing sensor histidine kinase [Bacillales bacterium]